MSNLNLSDVEDVKFVINFDYPSCSEDYVHRIGRTGRRQKTGTAYTFFTPNNANKANDLIQVLKEANQVINPKLLELADGKAGGYGRNRGTFKTNTPKNYYTLHKNEARVKTIGFTSTGARNRWRTRGGGGGGRNGKERSYSRSRSRSHSRERNGRSSRRSYSRSYSRSRSPISNRNGKLLC